MPGSTLPGFDPSAAPSGSFNTTLPNGVGTLLIANHSGIEIKLTFQDGATDWSYPLTIRRFDCKTTCNAVTWTAGLTMAVLGGYNWVDITAFSPADALDIPEVYPIALSAFTVTPPATFATTIDTTWPSGANTWTLLTTDAENVRFSIGNLPFANQYINAGLAAPGVLYGYVSAWQMSLVPHALDKATVEGASIFVRIMIYDNVGARVGSFVTGEAYPPDGRVFSTVLVSVSGTVPMFATWSAPVPESRQIQVAAGNGAPYTAGIEGFIGAIGAVTLLGTHMGLSWGVTPLPPNSLPASALVPY